MIKKNSIYILILCLAIVGVIVGFSLKKPTNAHDGMLQVESVPLHTASGWGYEILVDHKIFIEQQYVPAIAGKKVFSTKEDAMKTAELVIEKIVHGKKPSITKDDLTALKISFQ